MENCTKAVLLAMIIMSLALTNILPSLIAQNAAISTKAMQQAADAQKRAEDAELSLKKQQVALQEEAKVLSDEREAVAVLKKSLEAKGCR